MNRPLVVFVHGRAQGDKDPAELKKTWIETLRTGLGLERRSLLDSADIEFPYYGDKLDEFVRAAQKGIPADIGTRGDVSGVDQDFLQFQEKIAEEARRRVGLTDAQVDAEIPREIRERGPLNWEWVQAILRALDKVPGVSSRAIETFTRDVYLYIARPAVRSAINGIVAPVIRSGKTVVVGHSLGSVVAYDVLRKAAPPLNVPLYLTVGSPLAIGPIRDALIPIKFPVGVKAWYNALDERDVVALYPLNIERFPLDPPIENYTKVRNGTENAHGILGYLNDAIVAKRLYDALV